MFVITIDMIMSRAGPACRRGARCPAYDKNMELLLLYDDYYDDYNHYYYYHYYYDQQYKNYVGVSIYHNAT